MVFKCCVTGCKSNYDSSSAYVTVYSFPLVNADRLNLWVRKIPRENLVVNKNTRICIKHFEDQFLIKQFEFTIDGIKRTEPRERPLLTDDAFPTIFPSLPSYLSTPLPRKRRDPCERRVEACDRDTAVLESFLADDLITSYECFVDKLHTKTELDKRWIISSSPSSTVIFVLDDVSYMPRIAVSVKVEINCVVRVFIGESELPSHQLSWLLNSRCSLRRWSQFENILSHYVHPENRVHHDDVVNSDVVRRTIDKFCCFMETTCLSLDFDNDDNFNMPCLIFCVEQLRLACVNVCRRRYSSDLLRFAFLLYNRSSACYRILAKMGSVILPHASTLKKLSSVLSVELGNDREEQSRYLHFRASQLTDQERYVVLQLDEIHVNPSLSFKGGAVTGVAFNTDHDQAHSIQAFMISSLFSKFKDIVSLTPVKCLTSDQLAPMLYDIMGIVQNAGFIIVVVVSDNNQVNAKAFQTICGSNSFEEGIDNPHHVGQKIFFLFDTVHILKCVRNNWLNQTDRNQTFFYPPLTSEMSKTTVLLNHSADDVTNISEGSLIRQVVGDGTFSIPNRDNSAVGDVSLVAPTPNTTSVCSLEHGHQCTVNCQVPPVAEIECSTHAASVSCIKRIYESERNSFVKQAHRLSYKTLYPTNLERQQVPLVLNIFNETTVVALEMVGTSDCNNTADFVRLMTAWWRIVNVQNACKGVHKRDELSYPISDVNDPRLDFLQLLCKWLNEWDSMPNQGRKGCLTAQTMRALSHTSATIVHLVKYVLTKLQAKYILLAKIQTDNLEKRFGEYRQLCGANYNVSVQQVLEAEKKLRVSSLLCISSSKHGHVAVRDIRDALLTDDTNGNASLDNCRDFSKIPEEVLDKAYSCDEHSLIYITGYAVHKLMSHCKCELCLAVVMRDRDMLLTEDSNLDFQYLDSLNRGGLKYPSLLAILVAYKVFCVLQLLISKQYEHQFLLINNQKEVLCTLVKSALNYDEYFQSEAEGCCCECDTSVLDLLTSMLPTFANIFLFNYTKVCNDAVNANGGKKRKLKSDRKLKTLTG
jgi:THAP domain/Transposase protein